MTDRTELISSKDMMTQEKQLLLINLHLFTEAFFREAIRYHVYEYYTHFQNRLAAIYVGGSVHRNEAVPGASDLDMYPFILDTFNEGDEQWFNQAEERVESKFPAANSLCPPRPVNQILGGLQPNADDRARIRSHAWVHRLRYDTTLVWGNNLVENLNVPDIDRKSAGEYFQSAWDLVRYAAGIEKENKSDYGLPINPPRRLRKLARLAVLGGAYFLAGQGKLYSFKGAEVLPLLKQHIPRWCKFLNETEELYIPLNKSTTEKVVSAYLSRLVPWMDWVREQLTAG